MGKKREKTKFYEVSGRGQFLATVWRNGQKLFWAGGKTLVRSASQAQGLFTRSQAYEKARSLQKWIDIQKEKSRQWWENRRKEVARALKRTGRTIATSIRNGVNTANINRLQNMFRKPDRSEQSVEIARLPGRSHERQERIKYAIARRREAEIRKRKRKGEVFDKKDAVKNYKSSTSVQAHDRAGTKGVSAHQRNLTQGQRNKAIAQDLLKDKKPTDTL